MAGSNLAFRVQSKINAKRDPEMEKKALAWIEEVTGQKSPAGLDYTEILKDGTLLCAFVNKLAPGSVKKVHTQGADFKMVENLNNFTKAIKEYGVPTAHVFQTVDLWELKDINSVTDTIYAIGREVHNHPDFKGPFLVPKPAS